MLRLMTIATVVVKAAPELNKPMLFAFLGLCAVIFYVVERFVRRSFGRQTPPLHELTRAEQRRIESRVERLFGPVHHHYN
jgi:hypothetical protein